jgi:hypothetical protein
MHNRSERYEGLDVASSIHPKSIEVLELDQEQRKAIVRDLLGELWSEQEL